MKKIIIVLIVSIIGIGLILSGAKVYQFLKIKKAKVEVELVDNLKVDFNDEVKVSDFIKSINGKIVDDYKINTTKVGNKTIVFDFINDDGIKLKYNYDIEIVDTVEPVIWLGSSYSIKKDTEFNINNILCGDNYDSKPNCYVEGTYDSSKVGSYPLVFKAIDSSGNVATQNFVLNVYEPKESKTNSNSKSNSTSLKDYTKFSDIKEKYKTNTNKVGLDISKWQGDVDFSKLKENGVEFVIIRVGYTKGTNGEYVLDNKFIDNIKSANENNIPVGIYFYSYANSRLHSIMDAIWVISQIKDYKVELPIAFDWEEWKDFNEYNLSFFDLTSIGEAFLATLEEYGYKGMLYSSKSYLEYIWLPTKYDIWLAHYTSKTNYKGNYKMWQLCDDGVVDGINGSVDIDIMYD